MRLIHASEENGLTQKTWELETGDMPDLDREMRRLRWMRRLCLVVGHSWGIGHVNGAYGPLPFWGQCQRCTHARRESMDAAFRCAEKGAAPDHYEMTQNLVACGCPSAFTVVGCPVHDPKTENRVLGEQK